MKPVITGNDEFPAIMHQRYINRFLVRNNGWKRASESVMRTDDELRQVDYGAIDAALFRLIE